MITKTDVFNSYNVTFVFDNTSVITTVFAMSEEAAIPLAADCAYEDMGFSKLSSFLFGTQEITVELLDEDVL
jgi:hypothetical protein